MSIIRAIEEKLGTLDPALVEVADESSLHAGHEGAKSGGGHYRLTIVSAQFSGKNTLARHRMIYAALGGMMQRQIHALAIRAYTPDEVQTLSQPQ